MIKYLFFPLQMSFIGSILGTVGGIVGSLIGADSQEKSSASANETNIQLQRETNKFNAEEAAKNRDWQDAQAAVNRGFQQSQALQAQSFSADQVLQQQRYNTQMSNTSYQRAVADLKAAGLNPMLAYSQGGASSPASSAAAGITSAGSTPGGGQASGTATRVNPTLTFNKFGQAIQAASSAAGALVTINQADNVAAQTRNIDADTINKLMMPANIDMDTKLKGSQSYAATTQGHVNQATETKLHKTLQPLIDQIKSSANLSTANAQQVHSQNVLIKDLMDNPDTRPFAPILQILLNRR